MIPQVDERLIYKHTFKLSKVAKDGNPSLEEVLDAFQQAAVPHAEELGFGNTFLTANDLLFVICRMELTFKKPFKAGETYTVLTCPLYPSAIQVYRVAFFYDSNNEEVASLNSLWVLVNRKTKRITPMRPVINICEPYKNDMKKIEETFYQKLPALDVSVSKDSQPISYTVTDKDIDFNGHMNNAVYARILDSIQVNKPISTFTINFEKECLLDETLFTYQTDSDDCTEVAGYKSDGDLSYKAKITYR